MLMMVGVGWEAISHLGTHWGGLLPAQELLEVGLQWWGTLENPHPPQLGWSQPPPLVLTNCPLLCAPQSTTLVGATGRTYLPQNCVLGSPLVRVLSL